MTSSFVTAADSSGSLEGISQQRKSTSLKNLNLFGRSKRVTSPTITSSSTNDDKTQQQNLWIATTNNNNNNESNASGVNKSPPDYRTFLRNIRPPVRPSISCSEDEESNDEEDNLSDSIGRLDTVEVIDSHAMRLSNNEDQDITEMTQLGSLRGSHVVLKINITDQKLVKCLRVKIFENIWTVKQRIIQGLSQKPSFSFNYGLFNPATGRFLLDHKKVAEYMEAGSIVPFEFRYKRRIFHVPIRNRKDSRRLVKMQMVTKQRELMTHVRARNCEKLTFLLRKGVDPNFHEEEGDETPLTLLSTFMTSQTNTSATTSGGSTLRRKSFLRSASLRKSWNKSTSNLHLQPDVLPDIGPLIVALVSTGGAHLDFRNRQGYTPLHVAARCGNSTALKTLLELGASPDAVDTKGLTALYHCCAAHGHTDDVCVQELLRRHADIACVDSQKWNVLHQMCRYGHLDLLCVFLQKIKTSLPEAEADERSLINSQNATGNTPLHICAIYNQQECLVTLLDHGADPNIRNFNNQDPSQVAIVAGNSELTKLISEYPTMKQHDINHLSRKPTSTCPSNLMTSSSKRHTISPETFAKVEETNLAKPKILQPSKHQMQRYDKDLPPNATLPRNSIIYSSSKKAVSPKKDSSEENVMYIACEDYQSESPDHISVKTGQQVKVTKSVAGDSSELFYVVHIGETSGLVPERCLQPVQLRKPFENCITTVKTSTTTPFSKQNGSDSEAVENNNTNHNNNKNNRKSKEMRPLPKKETSKKFDKHHTTPTRTGPEEVVHQYKDVVLHKGSDGYGFVLRGTKANGEELQDKFTPTSRNPGLQYLESVDSNGPAYHSGLRSGDVLLKVNGTDVRCMGHSQIVEFIRKCGSKLHIHVARSTTDNNKPQNNTSVKSSTNKRPVSCVIPPPPPLVATPSTSGRTRSSGHTRTGSVASAITKLDNVIALESGGLSEPEDQAGHTRNQAGHSGSATLKRIPGGRQIRPSELQNIFTRNSTNDQQSATLTRQLKKVTTPTLPNKDQSSPHRSSPSCELSTSTTSSMTSLSVTSSPSHQRQSSNGVSGTNMRPTTTFQDELMATIRRQGAKKKEPPPPPKRTDSRLSVASMSPVKSHESSGVTPGTSLSFEEELKLKQRLSLSRESNNVSPPVKRNSCQVDKNQRISSNATRTPSISNKVEDRTSTTSSPLELALKAKKESLQQQILTSASTNIDDTTSIVTSSLVKPSDIKLRNSPRSSVHEAKRNSDQVSFQLPPPPAPIDIGNELFNHPRFSSGNAVDLPPPPDESLLNSPASEVFNVETAAPPSVHLPPPPLSYSSKNSSNDISSLLPPATNFVDAGNTSSITTVVSNKSDSNSTTFAETSSNTDSGIEPNQSSNQILTETGSVISTISNISSEDGSDFGVSMSFDPRNNGGGEVGKAYLELIRKHNSNVGHSPTSSAVKPMLATPSTNPKSLDEWSVAEVGDWLRGLGLEIYAPAFAENEIAGAHLPDLGKDDLIELGVKRIGHRLTIEKSLKSLK